MHIYEHIKRTGEATPPEPGQPVAPMLQRF